MNDDQKWDSETGRVSGRILRILRDVKEGLSTDQIIDLLITEREEVIEEALACLRVDGWIVIIEGRWIHAPY